MAEGGNGEAPAACASRRFCRGGSRAKAGLGTPKPKTRLCTASPATGAGRAQTGEGRGGGVRTGGRWSGTGRKRGRGVRARHKGEETRDARVCAALKSRAREAFASGKLRTRRSREGVTRAPPFLPPPPPPAGRAPPPRPGRCQVSPAQRPGPRQRLLLARGSLTGNGSQGPRPRHAMPRRPPGHSPRASHEQLQSLLGSAGQGGVSPCHHGDYTALWGVPCAVGGAAPALASPHYLPHPHSQQPKMSPDVSNVLQVGK